ncbi:MAG TPA: farnesyl diphosphate synthase, partial [Nevskiaceae bacterium]|nr:farnesyl diphosphate synthase [Nevskiaceae bacterium]
MNAAFATRVEQYQQRLDAVMSRWLPAATAHPARLHQAMRYACEGGKHLRPQLVYAAGEVLGVDARELDGAAAAVELIHAYSLVHDDLPAMDNDDLRRGKPTCHRAFDEATAVLAGDALQALAFQLLAEDRESQLQPQQRVAMIATLAEAAGSHGMVGGQAIDLESEGRDLNLAELESLHVKKTGALIRACVRLAAHARVALDHAQREALDRYGKCIGLAFQIQDDVLDVESNSAKLGKTAGKDEAALKSTYPSVMGLPAAKQRAADLFGQARAALAVFGDTAEPLHWL